MPQLTEHFAESEFFVAGKCGEVSTHDRSKAFDLAYLILEPLRSQFGIVKITSGKRSAEHNAIIGGAAQSDHLYLAECAAADFTLLSLAPPAMEDAFKLLYTNLARFIGQAIIYLGASGSPHFLHVSRPSRKHVGEFLTATYEKATRGRSYAPYKGGKILRP